MAFKKKKKKKKGLIQFDPFRVRRIINGIGDRPKNDGAFVRETLVFNARTIFRSLVVRLAHVYDSLK